MKKKAPKKIIKGYAVICEAWQWICVSTPLTPTPAFHPYTHKMESVWPYAIFKTKKEAQKLIDSDSRHDGHEMHKCNHKLYIKKIVIKVV